MRLPSACPGIGAGGKQYLDNIIFGQINIDDEPVLAEEEQIEVAPTLLIYQGGRLLGSIVAPESKAGLEDFIEENLNCLEARRDTKKHIYDMIIICGGPGGYSAGHKDLP